VDDILSYAEEQGFTIWRAMGLASLSRWTLDHGDPTDAVTVVERALAALRESGTGAYTGYVLGLYGRALTSIGKPEAGMEQAAKAFALIEENGARWCEVEVLRAMAGCKIALRDSEGAEATLNRALAVAERQDSRMLELRVASDLAELRLEGEGRGEAREVLSQKVSGIVGGNAEREVLRARALINPTA